MANIQKPILACFAVLCAFSLQGCDVNPPRHMVGNWEAKPNYLSEYQYSPPGKPASNAILNSCSDPSISAALQCSGHGFCRRWNDLAPSANPTAPKLSFCECSRDYADPECTTPRKSQVTAFALSVVFGMFGADQFYLGYGWYGVAKLLTLGGAGIWYVFDMCRIGSSPVLVQNGFRVAADLSHFAFVLTVVTVMLFIGFGIAIWSLQRQRVRKAHELLLLRTDQQESREDEKQPSWKQADPFAAVPLAGANFSGYGAMIPRSLVPPVTLPPTAWAPPSTNPLMAAAPMTLPPVTLPMMSSFPATEYSMRGPSVSSPTGSVVLAPGTQRVS